MGEALSLVNGGDSTPFRHFFYSLVALQYPRSFLVVDMSSEIELVSFGFYPFVLAYVFVK